MNIIPYCKVHKRDLESTIDETYFCPEGGMFFTKTHIRDMSEGTSPTSGRFPASNEYYHIGFYYVAPEDGLLDRLEVCNFIPIKEDEWTPS